MLKPWPPLQWNPWEVGRGWGPRLGSSLWDWCCCRERHQATFLCSLYDSTVQQDEGCSLVERVPLIPLPPARTWTLLDLGLGLSSFPSWDKYTSIVWATQPVVSHYGSPGQRPVPQLLRACSDSQLHPLLCFKLKFKEGKGAEYCSKFWRLPPHTWTFSPCFKGEPNLM